MRSGSKGIEGKNVKLITGKPLIALSIESALMARKVYKYSKEIRYA